MVLWAQLSLAKEVGIDEVFERRYRALRRATR